MFLLLLMVLGAASVKAQVRIGGKGAPNASAVLDLNATDATTGTKGLALPRVNLTSDTMQLTKGVANITGMLVYNTAATLGNGMYCWNGTNWDILMGVAAGSTDTTLTTAKVQVAASWVKAFDTTVTMTYHAGSPMIIRLPWAISGYLCQIIDDHGLRLITGTRGAVIWAIGVGYANDVGPLPYHYRCYAPTV